MYRLIILCLIFIKETSPAPGYRVVMQRIVHSLSCFVLAFALILTGPGGSGPAKGDILVELCADGATSLVWMDTEGNPIAPGETHVKCLDCLLFSAPLPDSSDALLTFDLVQADPGQSLKLSHSTRPVAHLRPIPRAPPAMESKVLRFGGLRPDVRSLHPLALQALDHHQAAHRARVIDPRAMI
jgi:hypothetical protein